ncbi:MAG: nucleoside hydrolase [Firmicutes bacterium]|nr:nucleoside hydrolase [Bacillota bacterium]
MAEKRRVILDMDPGVDDALAIIYAVKSGRLDIAGITAVAGNVEVQKTSTNALKVLELLDAPGWPVAVGSDKPLKRALVPETWVHGENGLGDVQLPEPRRTFVPQHAVDFIIETVRKNPGELTLVPTGPLTNVARAFLKDPQLPKLIKEIILMGGAASTHGNSTAVAEFNIWADPDAAKVVFRSGADITMVGLDVTMRAYITPEDVQELRRIRDNRVTAFVEVLTRQMFGLTAKIFGKSMVALHDPLAVGMAIDSSYCTVERMPVEVETESQLTLGQTVCDRRPWRDLDTTPRPYAKVCVAVDRERFVEDFLATLAHQ